jgi:chromosome segregation ATPase
MRLDDDMVDTNGIQRINAYRNAIDDDRTRITKLEIRLEHHKESTDKLESDIQKLKLEVLRVDDKVDKINENIREDINEIKEQFTTIRVSMLERFASLENQIASTVTKVGFITATLMFVINLGVPVFLNILGLNKPPQVINRTVVENVR